MRERVKKCGNSTLEMQAVRLQLDDAVDVCKDGGRIVIEPLRAPAYDLAQLLEGITPANLHLEVSFGTAVGKEMLR